MQQYTEHAGKGWGVVGKYLVWSANCPTICHGAVRTILRNCVGEFQGDGSARVGTMKKWPEHPKLATTQKDKER